MKRKLLSDNPNEVVRILFRKFGLKYDAVVEQRHQKHPLYPSYQSIAYILSCYGVDNCLIETDAEELATLPKPLVINYDGLFLLLEEVTETELSISNEKNGVDKSPLTMLDRFWSKTALVFDTENIIPRKSPVKELIRYYFNNAMKITVIMFCVVAVVYLFFQKTDEFRWLNYAFFLTAIVGIVVGILFQIQEFDRSNKLVNKICHARRQHGKKDCASILDSADAKFFGLFSWADFGLLFFLYLTVLPLFVSPTTALATATIFSMLAATYIPYSIYYQWRIARKWCMLCLMTQGILFVNLVVSILAICSGYFKPEQFWNSLTLLSVFVVGVATTALFTTAKIYVKEYREHRAGFRYFNALKHDYSIKKSILESVKEVSTAEIDKIILQPDGTDILTVIFNPVCTPCMRKMRQLLNILKRKKDTKLELIFLLEKDDRVSYDIASRFLALYFEDRELFHGLLTEYAERFPKCVLDGNAEGRNVHVAEVLRAQDAWCAKNGITSTPRLYLNGREVPQFYTVEDVDYMIN